MKHHNAAVIGSSDLTDLLIISCLYHRPIEAAGGLVVAQMSMSAELTNPKQLIGIELVSNTRFLNLPIIEERKVAPWPKDSLLVKRGMVNSKGFRRKGINPGRR